MSEDIERSCETCALNSRSCRKKVGECHKANDYSEWRPKSPRFPEDSMAYAETSADQPALATQVGGGHYKGYAIQPVEFCMKNKLDYCQSNIIKYVVRFRDKNGMEDLRKAKHYLEMLMEFEDE